MPVYLPEPLQHQAPAFDASCRFKVLNCGRRWGKDRLEFTAAVAGHGPGGPKTPMFPGAAQGWTVVWLARDFSQAKGIWLEEFQPRFKPEPQIYTNENDFRIILPNGGSVCIFSDKNVDSIRGLGKKIKGFITNEGAHLDLEYAWLRVVRPILADNQGWAILASTPIAGSYFNELALEVKQGQHDADPKTGPWDREWGYWEGTVYDNPTIPTIEADALARTYVDGTAVKDEEFYARLLPGGKRLAFPMWHPKVHVTKDFAVPKHWKWVAGMDWGITAESVVILAAVDSDRRCLLAREWVWRDKDAYEAGYDLAYLWLNADLPGWPETLWCDSAMDAATGIGNTTVYQQFVAGFMDALKGLQTPPTAILPAPKGPGSLVAGYDLQHKQLAWGPPLQNEAGQEWVPQSRMPRTRIVNDTEKGVGCPYLCSTIPRIRLNPKKGDQVAEGTVEETGAPTHAVAAWRYLLAGTWPRVAKPERDVPQNVHPGFVVPGVRRKRERTPEVLREEQMLVAEWQAQHGGTPLGGAYGRNARRL